MCQQRNLTDCLRCVCQVFGKDNVLTLGGETAESRQQWADDMDIDVSFVILLESVLLNLPKSKNGLQLLMMLTLSVMFIGS